MIRYLDSWLNRLTMYRVVLYSLLVWVGSGMIAGLFGWVRFSPLEIAFSAATLVAVSYLVHAGIVRLFHITANTESVYITALILALIVSPATSFNGFLFLVFVAVLAELSKFLLAYNKKHLFNPAAVAVWIAGLMVSQGASWWVGNQYLTPVSIVLGLIIVHKIRREDMVFAFIAAAALMQIAFGLSGGSTVGEICAYLAFHSPFFFLGFVMLTDPLTAPSRKRDMLIFGALVGFLSSPQVHVGELYFSPELALLVGNLFAYLVSPKQKLFSHLVEKLQLSPDTLDFIFPKPKGFTFEPGQYMEFTLAHPHTDSRGNRRYLTIASSPTEDNIRLGVKFYPNSSTYKQALLKLENKDTYVGAYLAGDFVLPKDTGAKLVFIAGGIGVTPFRSMLKYLIDTKQKRDIAVFYSNKTVDEIVYQDVFAQASLDLGIPVYLNLTDKTKIPFGWKGGVGRINSQMIKSAVPDCCQRMFFISGPPKMVDGFREALRGLGVRNSQIKVDYFPGFA